MLWIQAYLLKNFKMVSPRKTNKKKKNGGTVITWAAISLKNICSKNVRHICLISNFVASLTDLVSNNLIGYLFMRKRFLKKFVLSIQGDGYRKNSL